MTDGRQVTAGYKGYQLTNNTGAKGRKCNQTQRLLCVIVCMSGMNFDRLEIPYQKLDTPTADEMWSNYAFTWSPANFKKMGLSYNICCFKERALCKG